MKKHSIKPSNPERASRRSSSRESPALCGADRNDECRSRQETAPAECPRPRRGAPPHIAERRWLAGWDMVRAHGGFSLLIVRLSSHYAAGRGAVPAGLMASSFCKHCPTAPHADNIESIMTPLSPSAAASGTFLIGGNLPVHRLGYGTMRPVGAASLNLTPGDWAEVRSGGGRNAARVERPYSLFSRSLCSLVSSVSCRGSEAGAGDFCPPGVARSLHLVSLPRCRRRSPSS